MQHSLKQCPLKRTNIFIGISIFFGSFVIAMEHKDALHNTQTTPLKSLPIQSKPSDSRSHHFFEHLPTNIMLHVIDFLHFQDHFSLAQTSKAQLFLWASSDRLPESRSKDMTTCTAAHTAIKWSQKDWPTTTHPTLIVNIDTKKNVEKEDIKRLNVLQNLETLKHLHFVASESDHIYIDILWLTQGETVGARLISLESLVLEGLPINEEGYGVTLPHLNNFVIKGTAVLPGWKENYDKDFFPLSGITHARPQLRNILFFRSQLEKINIKELLTGMENLQKSCDRVVEVYENHLDLEGNCVSYQEPWQEGLSFVLKPWVLDTRGNMRMGYKYDHIVAGKAKLRSFYIKIHDQKKVLSWDKFLTFLSQESFDLAQLLPFFRLWTHTERFHEVMKLIHKSSMQKNEQEHYLVLPFEYYTNLEKVL